MEDKSYGKYGVFTAKENENIIKHLRLECESVHNAWYELALKKTDIGYLIEKASGTAGHFLHSEIWFRSQLSDAEKKFSAIIADKTNPNRKSPRKYHIVPTSSQTEDSDGNAKQGFN